MDTRLSGSSWATTLSSGGVVADLGAARMMKQFAEVTQCGLWVRRSNFWQSRPQYRATRHAEHLKLPSLSHPSLKHFSEGMVIEEGMIVSL
jgi:hypothetical protein